jgi:hypothetical protein
MTLVRRQPTAVDWVPGALNEGMLGKRPVVASLSRSGIRVCIRLLTSSKICKRARVIKSGECSLPLPAPADLFWHLPACILLEQVLPHAFDDQNCDDNASIALVACRSARVDNENNLLTKADIVYRDDLTYFFNRRRTYQRQDRGVPCEELKSFRIRG